MEIDVHGPARAGGDVQVTVRGEPGDDPVEVRLESFEVAGDEQRDEVHDRRQARPGELVRLRVPADATPSWSHGRFAAGWRVAVGGGLILQPRIAPVEIDPASVAAMTDDRAGTLRTEAAAAAHEANAGDIILVVAFSVLALAIVAFGIFVTVSPREDQPAAVGPVVIAIGILFPIPGLIRFRRKVQPLRFDGCTLDADTWTARGGEVSVRVDADAPADVTVLCRIDWFVRGRTVSTHNNWQPGGAGFREEVLDEQRRQVDPGRTELTFPIAGHLPPTFPGEIVRVRHLVQATARGAGRNTHRRTETQFVVA